MNYTCRVCAEDFTLDGYMPQCPECGTYVHDEFLDEEIDEEV